MAATTRGALGLVAMVAALYPVATVACARVYLGERLSGTRRLGVVAAIAGVAVLAASQA
jgi:drug/metabolite transporter (DMT)-like permease